MAQGGFPASFANGGGLPMTPSLHGGANGVGGMGAQIELQQQPPGGAGGSEGGVAASRWKAASYKAQALGLMRRAGAGQSDPQSSVVALLRADPSWEQFYELARGFIQAADIEGRGYIRQDDLSGALQVVWRAKGGGGGGKGGVRRPKRRLGGRSDGAPPPTHGGGPCAARVDARGAGTVGPGPAGRSPR